MKHIKRAAWLIVWSLSIGAAPADAQPADLILHGSRVATVDAEFSVRQAIAVRDARIVAVGDDDEALALRGDGTQVVDLDGRLLIPGLIDLHVHPQWAALHEFDHPIPAMRTIADVLSYVRSRAAVLPEGRWIVVRQVFITRIKEQRYPTREELDAAAPEHPVLFRCGPDAMANSLAL